MDKEILGVTIKTEEPTYSMQQYRLYKVGEHMGFNFNH